MAIQIQLRRDTAANWTANDPTLANGEIGLETDTSKIKIGDGSTAWTSLAYFTAVAGAHASDHENAGADEINVGGLSGELADNQPPKAHKADHENGGGDEINVGGLSGELADNQPPKAHKTSHQSGGGDSIKLDDLAAPDDNTDLNASTSKHGLLKKLDNVATNFMNGQGNWAAPAGGGGGTKIEDGTSKFEIESTNGPIVGTVAGTEAFRQTTAGIVTWAKQSAAKAYRTSSQQVLPTGAWTKVQLNAEAYDVQNEFDPSTNYRFTATEPGTYSVVAKAKFMNLNDQDTSGIMIQKNGAGVFTIFDYMALTGTGQPLAATPVELAANDYLELFAYHDYGSNRNLATGEDSTFMAITKTL